MLVTFFFCNSYFYLVYKNNVDTPPPSKQSIQQALDKSINWVLKNQDELIKINNPVLWWFLDESASLTNNYKLSKLIWKYRNTVLDKNSIWTGYWVKKPPFTYIPGSLDHMEKYQKFFTYGLTCDLDLSEEKVIQDQLDENFCDWHPYYSSCITHQIMGVRLLQIKQCGDQEQNKKLVKKLAKLIESQLIWDPRVGDVYIQRVLTLVDSGNKEKIKPVWIKQILNEQRTDGSWANFYRLFNIT
ncbi:hypothetical protein MNBD_GAMMA06-54, partial [hydrothermal vent metagenome]